MPIAPNFDIEYLEYMYALYTTDSGESQSNPGVHPIFQTQTEEPFMATEFKLETRHYVNDVDLSNYSKDALFSLLKQAEDKIADLKSLHVESVAVNKEVERIQSFINKLVEKLDAGVAG